jgi:outer membrane protein TolC/membrane protein DedA with SNARE-associated domain
MTHVIQYLLAHGALVVFAWILFQQAGAPIPGAPLLLTVGSLANSGRVNVVPILGATFWACVAADGFWYYVGLSGRSKLDCLSPRLNAWTRRVLGLMSRHSAGALLPAKFISLSNFAALMAGRARLPLGRFLVFDSIASLLWTGGYIAVGYLLGKHVKVATRYVSGPVLVLLAAFAVWALLKVMRTARPRWHLAVLAALTFFSCTYPASSQYSGAPGGTAQSSASSQASGLTGSVPSGTATGEVVQLTLRDAIKQGLRYNLATIESGENARIARGQRLLALSALLPQVNAGVSEHVEQESLTTIGLKVPGIPTVVGPFSYSSADASLSQALFSFESIQRFRAARTAEQAAQLNYQDDLDLVTLAVGNAYLQVIEANSCIAAQEAQVRNAKALYDQARDQVEAGTAPRIDQTRTEVQLHTEEYNLSVARNNFAVAKLSLGRAIGLPLGQEFELADQLPHSDINPPSLEDAIAIAYRSRSDLRAALDSQRAAQENLSAAKGERYPVVATSGDYGVTGQTFGHSHGTFSFQAGVNVPIFTGGRIKGDIMQADAEVRQRKAETENLRGQIDYDVRTAFLNLNAANEQVTVARQNVGLANDNLARSKDRFASGVTDSVEVVQAQQSLASANDQYITSLYNYNFAKLFLARALGVARSNYQQYLQGK